MNKLQVALEHNPMCSQVLQALVQIPPSQRKSYFPIPRTNKVCRTPASGQICRSPARWVFWVLAVRGSSPLREQMGTLSGTAGAAPWLFQLGAKGLPLPPSPSRHSREPPDVVPGCRDRENVPALGQEADQHFLLHRLQAASWGIIWENNGPFLPLVLLTPGYAQWCWSPACEIPTATSAVTSVPGASQRLTARPSVSSSPHTRDGHGYHHGSRSSRESGHGSLGKFPAVSEADRWTDSPGWATSTSSAGAHPMKQGHKATWTPPWPHVPSGRLVAVWGEGGFLDPIRHAVTWPRPSGCTDHQKQEKPRGFLYSLNKLNLNMRGWAASPLSGVLLSPQHGLKAAGRAGASGAGYCPTATAPTAALLPCLPAPCPFPGHLPTAPGGKTGWVQSRGLLEATKN